MIQTYFKAAWRNLVKGRFYSLINIGGLTLGLSIGMLILLWVRDEMSFDRFHTKASRIYRVNAHIGTGISKQVWSTTQAPIATYALKEIPGVVSAARVYPNDSYSVFSYRGKDLKVSHAAYTDASLFDVFDFPLLEGNRDKPFPNDQSVILTQSEARKYFGDEDPMGKTMVGDHTEQYTVSGIVADFPENSSIRYDMLFPITQIKQWYDGKDFWKSMDEDWGNFGYTTFLEVQPGTSLKAIGEQLIRIQLKHAPWIKVSLTDNPFELQPLSDIHLYQADGTGSGMQTVRIFFIVAVLILLIACINYVNLSTARAMLRAKEVSIRKIIGARKKQLFAQFFAETLLFFGLSMAAAFVLMAVLTPYYNDLSGKRLHFNLADAGLWTMVSITLVGTLLASAVYPSLLLSSFEPLKAIKGKLSLGVGDRTFRKILVTSQFVFSVLLIIGTLIIGRQLTFLKERDPGYDRAQVFTFHAGKMNDHLDAAKGALKNLPGVLAVASANSRLVNNQNTTGGIDWPGKDPRSSFIIRPLAVDADFVPTMKIKLVSGQNFTGAKTDSMHFLLNETAVRLMGIKDPVGKKIKYQLTEGTIIGVMKDYNFMSLKDKIEPAILWYQPHGGLIYVRTTGRDAARAIAAAGHLWSTYNPGFPFEYTFLDDDYAHLYKTEERTGALFNVFSLIAIVISCLGLLGLATYSAQIRTKEIGIRKVLGASTASIVSLVSSGFMKLVLVAVLIATPIAWWSMHQWLQDFAYRVDIGWSVFLLAGLSAFGIALTAIGFQSIHAALASPVKSLRTE